VFLMDLDNFKQINDTYGHKAGDTVIKTVAGVCNNSLRVTDIFGRYGGEEFMAFLPETPSEKAFQVAERLRQNIAGTRIDLDNNSIYVTASIGVACVEKAGNIGLDELLKNADEALYEAKKAGRNCVRLRLL
jgi:diguanylate cyclase (GGDEF)-like protein